MQFKLYAQMPAVQLFLNAILAINHAIAAEQRDTLDDRLTIKTVFHGFVLNDESQDLATKICPLLIESFGNDGEDYCDLKNCRKTLDWILQDFDCAYMIGREDENPVGFVVMKHETKQRSVRSIENYDYHAIITYNLCVSSVHRRQGIAAKLMRDFTQSMIAHYGLEIYAEASLSSNNQDVSPLVLGLGVEFASSMMPEAFSLYAKLGYSRWMAPCKDARQYDWSALLKEASLSYNSLAASLSLWNPASFLNNTFDRSSNDSDSMEELCMFRFASDSYHSTGSRIQNIVNQIKS